MWYSDKGKEHLQDAFSERRLMSDTRFLKSLRNIRSRKEFRCYWIFDINETCRIDIFTEHDGTLEFTLVSYRKGEDRQLVLTTDQVLWLFEAFGSGTGRSKRIINGNNTLVVVRGTDWYDLELRFKGNLIATRHRIHFSTNDLKIILGDVQNRIIEIIHHTKYIVKPILNSLANVVRSSLKLREALNECNDNLDDIGGFLNSQIGKKILEDDVCLAFKSWAIPPVYDPKDLVEFFCENAVDILCNL